MNRPGQPQQRPPNLTPTSNLGGPFRPPYPNYGIPPRNVMQQSSYVPGMPLSGHRTPGQTQTMVQQQQPSSAFMQQTGRGGVFAFGGGGLGQAQQQHQQSNPLQQQSHPQQQLSSQQHMAQQQQPNGSNALPPHLQSSNNNNAPSTSSTGELGLDMNDFPALGSTPASNNANSGSTTSGTASYATQAGTVPATSSTPGAGGPGSQPRDFTQDDFPALGGQPQQQQLPQTPNPPAQSSNPAHDNQNASASATGHSHPPGLNGFDHPQQNRQGMIAPGMLNLGPMQARSLQSGFPQSEAEKQQQQQRNNYSLKLNQVTQAAWNSQNANPTPPQQPPSSTPAPQNGAQSSQQQTPAQQNPAPANLSHLNVPPGVSQPSRPFGQQSPYHSNGASTETHTQPSANTTMTTANASNNPISNAGNSSLLSSLPPPPSSTQAHPQTPAQQILVSAADRWGLLGLLAMLQNAASDADNGLSSVGTDLSTMGLDMGYAGNLFPSFITPWSDQSAARSVEPDFHLPACYAVNPPPPGPGKVASFNDDTLLYIFYSSPRDALQEIAAQELWNRNWRFHKELRLWITKESGSITSAKIPGGEQGYYTIWDPELWVRERKEMTVLYADLEEKNTPAFLPGPNIALASGAGAIPGQQAMAVQNQQRAMFPIGVGAGM